MSDERACPICDERKPVVFGDVMCADCRSDFISRCVIVNDPVENILSQHQHLCGLSDLDSVMCMCAERFDGPGYHRVHVATLIYDALGIEGPIPWIPARAGDI